MARYKDDRYSGSGKRSDKPYNDDYKNDWDEDMFEDLDDDSYEEVKRTSSDSAGRTSRGRGHSAGRDYDRDDRESRSRRDYDRYDRESREGRDYDRDDRESRGRRDYDRYDRESRGRRDYDRYDRESRSRRDYDRDDRESRSRRDYDRYDRDKRDRRDYEDRTDYDPRRKKKGGCCLGGCLLPLLILAAIIAAVIYLGIGFFTGRMQNAGFSKSSIETNSDLSESTKAAMKNYRNIMLFGVDSRDQDPLAEGALADSCMLLSINKKNGDIKIVSIYRDTYVETTDGGHKKLTEVYAAYGPKETMQTINRNFDLNVTEYVTYTWAAVAHYIDGIGGMDLVITDQEAAGINKYIDEVIKNTGIESSYVSESIDSDGELVHLDGVQAVTYCRLRKGLGDDYKRTERQRTVVSKAVSMAKTNPIAAGTSAYSILPEIASNLNQTDLIGLLTGLVNYELKEAAGFPYDVRDVTLSGSSYLYAYTLIGNNEMLHENLFGNTDYEPSGVVQELHRKQGDSFGY